MPVRSSASASPPEDSLVPLLRKVVRALDEKKAVDLKVLRVTEQSSITDYLVLATGQAEPHLRALRVELEKVLDAAGAKIAGMETGDGSGWLVVDAYQIMVHLFLPAQRENYRLDQLWQDATAVEVESLLVEPKPAKKKRVSAKAGAGKAPAQKKPRAKPKKKSA